MKYKISIILPTFNEMATGYIQKSIPVLCAAGQYEVIAVDGTSTDQTSSFLKSFPIKLVETKARTRAERLNIGIGQAQGDIILLHHPRSLLSEDALDRLDNLDSNIQWGAFTHKFDTEHPMLDFTSRYSNFERGDKRGIYYLDHCLFFRRSIVEGDPRPVPEVDIFEDTEFCLKLRKLAKPHRLLELSTTSSYRFQKNGIWPQLVLNFFMKAGYHLKLSKKQMNKLYEIGLSLNSKY